jgi:transposase-like protein
VHLHLIRNSPAFVSWKDRKAILPAIKAIYRAENADVAMVRLEEFEAKWGKRYPAIGQALRRDWEHVVPSTGARVEQVASWPKRVHRETVDAVRDAARAWLDKRRSVAGYLVKKLPSTEKHS